MGFQCLAPCSATCGCAKSFGNLASNEKSLEIVTISFHKIWSNLASNVKQSTWTGKRDKGRKGKGKGREKGKWKREGKGKRRGKEREGKLGG